MARRIALAAALCALAVAVSATSAAGHAGNPDYESLVRAVTPAIPGFTVDVLNGDDRLEVQNTGKSTVTIDGYDEEQYLRLKPDGTVEVNRRSPAFYLNNDRDGAGTVPPSANAKASPQWSVVARTGRYEFHDHRMHWMAKSVPQQVTDKAKRTKIVDWQVPLQAQGKAGAIKGELFWRGSGPGAPVGAYIAFAALALLGGAAVVVVRRRRSAAASGGPASPRGEAW